MGLLVFDKVPTPEWIDLKKRNQKEYIDVIRGHKWQAMWNAKRDDYTEYCLNLQRMKDAGHPALYNTDLVFLEEFGHLFGTVKKAFEYIDTKFVFLHQHDLRVGTNFVAADVQKILEVLQSDRAKYVVLNRDVNNALRCSAYFRFVPSADIRGDGADEGVALTAMAGYSDQSHFAEVEWYRRHVIEAIGDQRTCMEHVL